MDEDPILDFENRVKDSKDPNHNPSAFQMLLAGQRDLAKISHKNTLLISDNKSRIAKIEGYSKGIGVTIGIILTGLGVLVAILNMVPR